MLKKISLALCVAGLLTSGGALADNAQDKIQVTFNGTVLENACTFAINGDASKAQTVQLGSIRAQAGFYTTVQKLSLSLSQCGVAGKVHLEPKTATKTSNKIIPRNAGEEGVGTTSVAFYKNQACASDDLWNITDQSITIDAPQEGQTMKVWDGYVRLEAGTAPKPGTINEIVDFVVTYQ